MRIILLLTIWCLPFSSNAANYFVNAKTGNVKYHGLSAEWPKREIQQAADLTKPGDTVFVMNGVYSNNCPTCNVVNISKSGTSLKPIVYTNYKGHSPILSFDGWGGFSIRNGASYLVITGFEVIGNNVKVNLKDALQQPQSCSNQTGIYDPRFNGNGIVIDGRDGIHPHHITIENNKVHDCGGGGISAIQADYVTVKNNLVYNTSLYSVFATSGISLYQFWNFDHHSGYHNLVEGNRCYNNKSLVPWSKACKLEDGNGIIIDDFENTQNGSAIGPYQNRTLVSNNVCWFNGGTAIHAFKSNHVDIINNTAYHNSRVKPDNAGEILAVSSYDIRIVNNILVTDGKNRINANYENSKLLYENNLHYNTTTPHRMIIAVNSSSSINGRNPMFKQAKNALDADFGLRRNSPAIKRAHPQLKSNKDISGKLLPKAKLADIGAHQTLQR